MFFSATRKLLFVHVYKTGGLSIAHALETEIGRTQTHRERLVQRLAVRDIAAGWIRRLSRLPQHASAQHVRDVVPPAIFDRWFKFAFVRNPWSLQLSLYRHVLNSPTHPQHAIFKGLKHFEAYIEWLGTRPNGVHRVQRDFLADEHGQLLVNFVGRFEHLSGDFAAVAAQFGWNSELSHLNRSGVDVDFRKYYSGRTRKIVEELHWADVETFGYAFDSCAFAARDSQLKRLPSRRCCDPANALKLATVAG